MFIINRFISLLVTFLIAVGASACHLYKDEKALIKGEIGIDVSGCTVKTYENTHGGFHGDGSTLIILDCKDDKENVIAQLKEKWRELPLTKREQYLGGRWFTEDEYEFDEDAPRSIPIIEGGYCLYIDKNHRDDNSSEFYDFSSGNYIMALYDTKTDKLYYYELDS